MSIETERYRDRLFTSTSEEGLVVVGPIDLDDIRILYSSHIDLLDELGKTKDERDIASFRRKVEAQTTEGDFSRNDLLSRIEDPEVIRELCKYVDKEKNSFTMRMGDIFSEEEVEFVVAYLDVLRKKLRPT